MIYIDHPHIQNLKDFSSTNELCFGFYLPLIFFFFFFFNLNLFDFFFPICLLLIFQKQNWFLILIFFKNLWLLFSFVSFFVLFLCKQNEMISTNKKKSKKQGIHIKNQSKKKKLIPLYFVSLFNRE